MEKTIKNEATYKINGSYNVVLKKNSLIIISDFPQMVLEYSLEDIHYPKIRKNESKLVPNSSLEPQLLTTSEDELLIYIYAPSEIDKTGTVVFHKTTSMAVLDDYHFLKIGSMKNNHLIFFDVLSVVSKGIDFLILINDQELLAYRVFDKPTLVISPPNQILPQYLNLSIQYETTMMKKNLSLIYEA